MTDGQNEQPKFPVKPGRYDPVPYDYGEGVRHAPRPRRKGKASDTAVGHEDWDPFHEP